jgi:hypothetical protein
MSARTRSQGRASHARSAASPGSARTSPTPSVSDPRRPQGGLHVATQDGTRVRTGHSEHTGNPPGKLADAEMIFEADAGPLSGLKLIGFGIWERRNGGRSVTFPARQYSVNGERRSFAPLRPANGDVSAQEAIRDSILDALSRVPRPRSLCPPDRPTLRQLAEPRALLCDRRALDPPHSHRSRPPPRRRTAGRRSRPRDVGRSRPGLDRAIRRTACARRSTRGTRDGGPAQITGRRAPVLWRPECPGNRRSARGQRSHCDPGLEYRTGMAAPVHHRQRSLQ